MEEEFDLAIRLFTWLTGFLLLAVAIYRKHYLLRPSFIALIMIFTRVQIGSYESTEYLYEYILEPWDYLTVTYFTPILILIFSLLILNKPYSHLHPELSNSINKGTGHTDMSLKPLWLFTLAIFVFYFSFVPFDGTGLYAILFSPIDITDFREQSVKLLPHDSVKYAYLLFQSTMAPLLGGFLALKVKHDLQVRNYSRALYSTLLICFLGILLAIPGSRAGAAYMVISVFLTLYYSNRMVVNPIHLAIAISTIVIIPLSIVIINNEEEFTIENLVFFWENGIYERFLVVPGARVGAWWIDYAQNNGFTGIAGIPKLAALFGEKPIDMANIIGLHYTSTSLDSISAGANFLYGYYNYFGHTGMILSIFLILLLDYIAIKAYKNLSAEVLPVTLAAIALTMVHSAETELIPLFITHGFLPILTVSTFLAYKAKVTKQSSTTTAPTTS